MWEETEQKYKVHVLKSNSVLTSGRDRRKGDWFKPGNETQVAPHHSDKKKKKAKPSSNRVERRLHNQNRKYKIKDPDSTQCIADGLFMVCLGPLSKMGGRGGRDQMPGLDGFVSGNFEGGIDPHGT